MQFAVISICKFSEDYTWHLPYGLVQFCYLRKIYQCLLTPNCTRNHAIIFRITFFHIIFQVQKLIKFGGLTHFQYKSFFITWQCFPLSYTREVYEIFKPIEQSLKLLIFLEFQAILRCKTNGKFYQLLLKRRTLLGNGQKALIY